VLFNFQEDNKWELKVDRIPGQSITIEATVNGQKWTGVATLNKADMKLNLRMNSELTGEKYFMNFDVNPAGQWGLHVTGDIDGPIDAKWTMQKDFKQGEVSIKYKNQNYGMVQLKGDYKLSRQGEFEKVSGSVYKIKWTGHGETTKGFLRRVSPVETNVVASVNVRNMKVDAIVWKSFAGQKYGFTLTNDKFTLLAGKH